MKLNLIPKWMEKYVSFITEGQCNSIDEIVRMCQDLKSWQFNMIIILNVKIDLLNKLRENEII